MGLSQLGQKKIRKIERITGLPVLWASVSCHGSWWMWRFWTPTPDCGHCRLGILDTTTNEWRLLDEWRTADGLIVFPHIDNREA